MTIFSEQKMTKTPFKMTIKKSLARSGFGSNGASWRRGRFRGAEGARIFDAIFAYIVIRSHNLQRVPAFKEQ